MKPNRFVIYDVNRHLMPQFNNWLELHKEKPVRFIIPYDEVRIYYSHSYGEWKFTTPAESMTRVVRWNLRRDKLKHILS